MSRSNGYHFMHGGKEIWRATMAEIRAIAKKVADKTGRPVSVRDGRRPKKRPAGAAPKKAAPARKITAKRNPATLPGYRIVTDNAAGRPVAIDFTNRKDADQAARQLRGKGRRADVVSLMKRNPDPLAYLGVWREQEKGRQSRLAYLAATKPTRLAKSRRPRGKSAPMPGSKTIKFRVEVKRGGEEYSFGRPSRAAAESMAAQYLAAGYKVKVSEA